MTSRNNILSYVLVAIALLTGFSSCISLDEYTPTTEVSGDIEFVVRPTSYNGQVVQTKATNATDFENSIHNCYLLLFNSEGNRVFISADMAGLSTYRISKSKIISLLGGPNATCTACFIANVPADVVNGLTTLSAVNSAVLDINYSNVDVLDANGKHSSFVVPDFDLDGSGSNEPVQCLPMFGMEECNLGTADLFEIPLKRLFAKVSVNIALGSALAQLSANFQLLATHLVNLPTKVRLAENTNECTWVADASSFMQTQIEGPINQQVTVAAPYEMYFYVPEYYLTPLTEDEYEGPIGTYNNEKYKPKKYETSKNPVLVKLFGKYDDSIFSGQQDVAYELYLGEDASTSFTLKRNRHYKNTVTIDGIANSMTGEGDALDWRVDVSDMDEVQVYGQTANCYVIGETGTYIYPACKGVWTEGLSTIPEKMMCSKGTHIEIIAQDSQSTSLTNLTYNPDSREFSFDVTSINDGNIIIGLTYMDNGVKKVEWSWHLWFVKGVNFGTALEGFFDVKSQQMPNGSEMMDRNLGANVLINTDNLLDSDILPGAINGFYYRYGFRNPYFKDAKDKGTTYHGLNESDYSTWNSEKKSVTDPCPPGYRVPASTTTWSGTATHQHDLLTGSYRYWDMGTVLDPLDDVYYPYSGYVDASGKIQGQGEFADPEILTINVNLPHEQDPWGTTITYGDLIRPTYPERFLNVKYRIHDIHTLGYALSSFSKLFEYSYTSTGIEIISCTYQQGTWDSSGLIFKTYRANYTGNKLRIDKQNITGEQLQSEYPTQYNNLIQRIQVIRAGNILESFLGSFTQKTQHSLDKDINTSFGYQVRCVRE